jgi:spore coat polysaccharide biosynthesis protein SpsF
MFKTEQESFWSGDFGKDYTERNNNAGILASDVSLFERILSRTPGIRSVIELGANIGLNLKALRGLLTDVELEAVEINGAAAAVLREWGGCEVREMSILDYEVKRQFDLAFTKGVLIHIDPSYLPCVYDLLHALARRYVLMAEYYNPVPVEVIYRGHQGKLFKRDFAGEFMNRFPDVCLLDYGFVYHRDPRFPMDDVTWFLMEKQQ